MKKTLIALMATILMFAASCEKDKSSKKTVVTINVKNGSSANQSGVDVYMYSKTVFTVQGNDPFFAEKTATTDANGNATFEIKNPDDVLWTPSNTSEELYFGVVYKISSVTKEKHVVVTVSEGDNKSSSLIMN
jgi:hypothetical protein